MAKNRSRIFKLQGTIDDVTFVNSKRYDPHIRAKKNSKTPFVMTAPLAISKERIQECNQYLKPIFQAMRPEVYEGGMWSKMVSLQFAALKAGLPLGLSCYENFECNIQHPLAEALGNGYDFSATREQNQVHVRLQLPGAPTVKDNIPRTGYQLRVVAIGPRPGSEVAYKYIGLGPVTAYDAPLEPVALTIPLPDEHTPVMLLFGIIPHNRKGANKIMSDSGMKVVWVG